MHARNKQNYCFCLSTGYFYFIRIDWPLLWNCRNRFFLWTYSNLILFSSVQCRLKIQAKWTTAWRKLLKLWFCFDPCSTIHFMGPHIVFVHIFYTEGLLHFWIYAGAWILQSNSNFQRRRREKAIHQLALTLRRDVATLRRGQHPKSDWVKVLQSN